MSVFSLVGNTGSNVGQIDGDLSKGVAKNFVIFGGKFTAADNADASSRATALISYSLKSKLDADKLLWLPEVQNIEDKSDSDKEGSLNLGFKTILVEGKPAYEIKVFGSSEFAKAVRNFNGKIVRVWEYDANEKLWGAQNGTDTVGYQAKIQTKGQKLATGQNVEEGVVTITISFLSTSEYFNSPKCIDLSDVDTSNVRSQIDAAMSVVSKASNVYKIGISLPTAQANNPYNVADKYTTELAQTPLWKAYTGTNYATTLAITSVSYDAATKAWAVTLDSTAFAALGAGASIKIALATPDILDAAGVIGIEGTPIFTTK